MSCASHTRDRHGTALSSADPRTQRWARRDTRLAPPGAAFAVQAGEGTTLETPIGDAVTIKAATEQIKGSLTVLELVSGPKSQRGWISPIGPKPSCGVSM